MGPVFNTFNPAMLDRIPMDIIDMLSKITFIPDHMFPKSPLPQTAFASFLPTYGNSFGFGYLPGKIGFDKAPAARKIGIPFRQGPNTM